MKNNNNIKSIHIPAKCKGVSRLETCSSLEKITVDKKSKFYYSDNNVLIKTDEENGDTGVFSPRNNSISEYKIPDGVARIDGHAFQYNKSLEKVIVPEGCKFIGCYAFLDCKLLKEITLPESLEKIEILKFEDLLLILNVSLDDINNKELYYEKEEGKNIRILKKIRI